MRSNNTGFVRMAAVAAVFATASLMTGCATQTIDLSRVKQGDPAQQTNLRHFKESGNSVYMLLDLIPVSPVSVDELVAGANPDNKPVVNLKITSQEDVVGFLVNLLNGGIIDRGVIVSMNNVTVEGDIVQP